MKALLCIFVLSCVLSAAALDTIVVGGFGVSILDRFAQLKGYFAEKNLDVQSRQVLGSDQQFDSLFSGEYDVISTTGDNIIYRRLNLGQEQLTQLTETSGSGGMWLLANKNLGINSIQDMAGKTLLTDSPLSGFVIPMRKIFKSAGVPLLDSNFIAVGGISQRIQALVSGTTNATMSSGATSLAVTANNPNIIKIGDLQPLVCPYLGGTLVSTHNWVNNPTNKNKLIRYLRAQLQAWKYITTPANKAEIVTFFKTSNSVTDAVANQIFDLIIASPDVGMNQYLVPRKQGLINGIELRVNDLGVSRGPCLPLSAELVSRPGGWINLGPLATAAGTELGYWNVLGQYYADAPVPCEQN